MKKQERRARRKKGIRKKIHGTTTKPRVSVYRSNRHLYVQVIDDDRGVTLCAISEREAGVKRTREGAARVGEMLGQKLKKAKISEAVFDRNAYIYHGVVQSIAEGIRKAGIRM
jgi:large subunit ribosomal protein L18